MCWLVCPLLLLSPGWSPLITGGCGCRGSTTLAQHAQCSLCSFYSCQPTDSLLPIMYSKQCFFYCLMFVLSVPVARAAVNRLLQSCYSFCFLFFYNLTLLWFGLSCLRQVPSYAQLQASVLTVSRCPFQPFHL